MSATCPSLAVYALTEKALIIPCNCRMKQPIFPEAYTCSTFSLAASPTRKMKNDPNGMPVDKHTQSRDATAVSERSTDSTTTNIIDQPAATADGSLSSPSTPTKTERTHDVNNIITTHTAAGSPRRGVGLSSYKRRRLASEDDVNITINMPTSASIPELGSTAGSARKLSYQPRHVSATSSDESDDDEDENEEDPFEQEVLAKILKKMKRLNGEDKDDQLTHTAAFAKLYEYMEGAWKYLGAGHVKVRFTCSYHVRFRCTCCNSDTQHLSILCYTYLMFSLSNVLKKGTTVV